jgi:hypothetical protein
MTNSLMTFRITTLSIMALGKMTNSLIVIVISTQHKDVFLLQEILIN